MGGIAQRLSSRFSPSGPGFESRLWRSRIFSLLLRGQQKNRTHLVLTQGISQMQLAAKAWAKNYKKVLKIENWARKHWYKIWPRCWKKCPIHSTRDRLEAASSHVTPFVPPKQPSYLRRVAFFFLFRFFFCFDGGGSRDFHGGLGLGFRGWCLSPKISFGHKMRLQKENL